MADANLAALQQQLAKNPKAGSVAGSVFLEPVIDFSKLSAANVSGQPNLQPFFSAGGSKSSVLVSEDEPQMIVNLQFTEHVELRTVVIRADSKPQSANNLYAPKEIWWIADSPQELDFDDLNGMCDLDDYEPKKTFGFLIQNPEVFQEHEEVTITFPAARFKSITKLCVFFRMNANDDESGDDTSTFINNMRFVGKPSGNKDISAWEPCKS